MTKGRVVVYSKTKAPEPEVDDSTKDELYERAQELDIEGRSTMNKAELQEAVEAEESLPTAGSGDED